jgi:hypothetical protein
MKASSIEGIKKVNPSYPPLLEKGGMGGFYGYLHTTLSLDQLGYKRLDRFIHETDNTS